MNTPKAPTAHPLGAAAGSPPILVHIPLRIIGKIREIAKDAQNPKVPYSSDSKQMQEEAYHLRGDALRRIERLVGLVPDVGVEKALEQWESI